MGQTQNQKQTKANKIKWTKTKPHEHNTTTRQDILTTKQKMLHQPVQVSATLCDTLEYIKVLHEE